MPLPVAHTACSILPDNMDKLFEPPFTTKAGGISKNIVEANESRIEVTSEEGVDSTLTERLPWQKKRGKMSERGWYVRLLVIVATILLAGCQQTPPPFECTDAIGCVDIAPGEPIQLGVLQTISGDVAVLGMEQVRSIELAMAQRDNQLLGRPIELQIEDEYCSSEGGTTAALNVVTHPQIVAILGTHCSGAATTAAKIMSEAGLVMISGSNSAPSLTAVGEQRGDDWQPGYFRTVHSGAEQGQAAAVFVFRELGVTKATTINDGDPYTRGLTDEFERLFGELGGEITLSVAVNKGDSDMHPLLAAVATSGAGVIFFPIFPPESDLIVRQAKDVPGLENVIYMTDMLSTEFIEAVGTDGVGMYFAAPALLEGPAIDKLAAEYESRYGEPPPSPYHVYAYDAANLLLNTIEAVAVQDADGTLHIGRQALRDALYATTGFEGVSGTLACDEFGDCAATKFDIVRLDDPSAGLDGLRSNVIYTYTPER